MDRQARPLSNDQKEFNSLGYVVLTDGESYKGRFYGFIVGDNGVEFTTLETAENFNVKGDLTSFPYSAGQYYFGKFTNVTVNTGDVLLLLDYNN